MRTFLLGLLLSTLAGAGVGGLHAHAYNDLAAELEAERANAKRYAAALAACANGDGFTIGEQHIQCKKAKR